MQFCGFSKENTWQITRRIASVLQHLGIKMLPENAGHRLKCLELGAVV
jgi:hypothetical protein